MIMSFGCRGYRDKIGILIAQLGTPEAPTEEALHPYLKHFLSDRRVIEANRFIWWFVLNFIVLRTRPKRSAALYKRIWLDEGSPLLVITEHFTRHLRKYFRGSTDGIEVEFGMRYGSPSLESTLDILIARGCTKILLFPMYPQYSGATTASTYDVVFKHILSNRWVPTLRVAEPYFAHPLYIRALAQTINAPLKKAVAEGRTPEYLVLSYHGIPEAYVKRGDPYCCMCTETTRLLLPHLSVSPEKVIHTYQSRFGKDPWLTPYTDETIQDLAKKGVKRIAVALPGFTADCLETLDEIGNEGSHLFKQNGGEILELIPCLNDQASWVEAAATIVESELGSWFSKDERTQAQAADCPNERKKAAN